MAPRWPLPRWPQDAPRWPRWPQDGPMWLQDGPKLVARQPKYGPQDSPRWLPSHHHNQYLIKRRAIAKRVGGSGVSPSISFRFVMVTLRFVLIRLCILVCFISLNVVVCYVWFCSVWYLLDFVSFMSFVSVGMLDWCVRPCRVWHVVSSLLKGVELVRVMLRRCTFLVGSIQAPTETRRNVPTSSRFETTRNRIGFLSKLNDTKRNDVANLFG
jgi:hypothetical protein